MAEYSAEKWVEIYQKALMELELAKMRGRIRDARVEIVERVEESKSIPDLNAQEDRALDDALSALRFLERIVFLIFSIFFNPPDWASSRGPQLRI
jgi:hypothetical protein